MESIGQRSNGSLCKSSLPRGLLKEASLHSLDAPRCEAAATVGEAGADAPQRPPEKTQSYYWATNWSVVMPLIVAAMERMDAVVSVHLYNYRLCGCGKSTTAESKGWCKYMRQENDSTKRKHAVINFSGSSHALIRREDWSEETPFDDAEAIFSTLRIRYQFGAHELYFDFSKTGDRYHTVLVTSLDTKGLLELDEALQDNLEQGYSKFVAFFMEKAEKSKQAQDFLSTVPEADSVASHIDDHFPHGLPAVREWVMQVRYKEPFWRAALSRHIANHNVCFKTFRFHSFDKKDTAKVVESCGEAALHLD